MATIDVTNETFAQTIQDNDIVLVDAWAEWCGPCRQFAPIFEQVSEQHSDVAFAKLDTDANQEISAALGIQSIPTLFLFREGILLFQQAGVMPPQALEDLLRQARELDMADVRRQIEEQMAADEAARGDDAAAPPPSPASAAGGWRLTAGRHESIVTRRCGASASRGRSPRRSPPAGPEPTGWRSRRHRRPPR